MILLPPAPVTLAVCSNPAFLPAVRALVDRMAELTGFDSNAAGRTVLAVDEAMTNVIRHAYKGKCDQRIEVQLRALWDGDRPRALEVLICDVGDQADLTLIRSPKPADLQPGGLGVHIISECMDIVEYTHPPEGGTCLRMVKNLPLDTDTDRHDSESRHEERRPQ